ncbi:MAG TPA: hypothetical protein VK633_07005 [Verrucomicrobiae bacterium]|nr:hypothetical protein [Verrucomicrobiae bacterium]
MITSDLDRLLTINTTEAGWEKRVQECIDAGTNFFLIFPGRDKGMRRFCDMFGLSPHCKPTTLTPAEFMLKSPYIDPEAFNAALLAWDNGCEVAFIEQLDFPVNHPPRVKPFIVYSALWGIISQHDDTRTASQALNFYRESFHSIPAKKDVDVYCWTGAKWHMK